MPNYFGPQRFGHGGSNIARARALLAQGWRKKRDRDGLLLSSARSLVFNNLLAERIADASWCRGLDGDIFNLAGSASQFAAGVLDDDLRRRLAALDIHPTGPLWGIGSPESDGEAAALERRIAQQEAGLVSGIEAAGARPARRALRVALANTAIASQGECARLRFELPRGSFATAVLRELVVAPGL